MDHDHDVGPGVQSFSVACFLVPAIAEVLVMDDGAQAEISGENCRVVAAGVVHQHDFIRHITGIS
jgi:hypothetical protein